MDLIKIMGNSDMSRVGIVRNSMGMFVLVFVVKGSVRKYIGNINIYDFNLCCLFGCLGKEFGLCWIMGSIGLLFLLY